MLKFLDSANLCLKTNYHSRNNTILQRKSSPRQMSSTFWDRWTTAVTWRPTRITWKELSWRVHSERIQTWPLGSKTSSVETCSQFRLEMSDISLKLRLPWSTTLECINLSLQTTWACLKTSDHAIGSRTAQCKDSAWPTLRWRSAMTSTNRIQNVSIHLNRHVQGNQNSS